METPATITDKARPFFLDYCQKLAEELTSLTTAPVVCTLSDITLLRGAQELGPLFSADRSVSYSEEDSSGLGGLHLIFDTVLSIALAGTLMMTSESVIQEKIAARDYDEETHEGFREVATQIISSLNPLLEEKITSGAHLFLESVRHTEADSPPASMDMEATHLVASIELTVASFSAAKAHWLFSRRLAAALLQTPIAGTAKEMAALGAVVEDEEEEEEEEELPPLQSGELLAPQVAGSVRQVMTETPFALKEEEKVMRGITAITQDGYRYIGVERKGALIRVLSQSDMHQVMGPFFDSTPVSPRDKALHALPIGKFNTQQLLIKLDSDGTINEAADLMQKHTLYALPVVSNKGSLRGFVPIHAVLDYFRTLGEKSPSV
ncbi:MAG: CBS domain-containing protein [Magnetococcus sp. MYC-9]